MLMITHKILLMIVHKMILESLSAKIKIISNFLNHDIRFALRN